MVTMTRTEIIVKELLDAVDQPETIEAVYSRHADSRGPFYRALAEATGVLRQRYNALLGKVRQEKDREEAVRSSVEQLENHLGKMQETESKLAKNIEKHQAVLDRLAELSKKGFSEAQLARLTEVLVGWSTKSGLKLDEAVGRFLEAAGRLTDILSLEQERARVEKEKTAAEAEAKKAIALSKLTTETVEAAKWLVSQRISLKTVQTWRAVASQLEIPAEGLAQGLADALKEYGTPGGCLQDQSQRTGRADQTGRKAEGGDSYHPDRERAYPGRVGGSCQRRAGTGPGCGENSYRRGQLRQGSGSDSDPKNLDAV
jgi:hypothetical protein